MKNQFKFLKLLMLISVLVLTLSCLSEKESESEIENTDTEQTEVNGLEKPTTVDDDNDEVLKDMPGTDEEDEGDDEEEMPEGSVLEPSENDDMDKES